MHRLHDRVQAIAAELSPWHYAAISFVSMGGFVGYINAMHGLWTALGVGVKQGALSAVTSGYGVRVCEVCDRTSGRVSAVLTPTFLTTAVTIDMHCFSDTPDPIVSSIPTFFVCIAFYLWYVSLPAKKGE